MFLVSSNSKGSETSPNLFESCGWKSARYAHMAWVCGGGREDVYTGEDKKPWNSSDYTEREVSIN